MTFLNYKEFEINWYDLLGIKPGINDVYEHDFFTARYGGLVYGIFIMKFSFVKFLQGPVVFKHLFALSLPNYWFEVYESSKFSRSNIYLS